MNQRWRERLATYRRPEEQIATAQHEVAAIDSDRTARAFVEMHHYSGTYPAARFRFGLYERAELVGVAVFSHPVRNEVLTNVFPGLPVMSAVELGRFVLLDRVAGNGETWFLARCFELLRGAIAGVVSFSDPEPRRTAAGLVIAPGHVGTIYQAANAHYLGRGRKRTLALLPDGTVLNDRAIAKIRAGDRGWRPAAAVLEAHGAPPIAADADQLERRRWVDVALAKLARPLKHPGNHRYAWIINRRHRRHLPASVAGYPKQGAST